MHLQRNLINRYTLVGMQIQELVALVLLSLKDTIVRHMIVLRLVEEQKRKHLNLKIVITMAELRHLYLKVYLLGKILLLKGLLPVRKYIRLLIIKDVYFTWLKVLPVAQSKYSC